MTTSPLLPLPPHASEPLPLPETLGWNHQGERFTAYAHTLTEREVRERRRAAAQGRLEQLTR